MFNIGSIHNVRGDYATTFVESFWNQFNHFRGGNAQLENGLGEIEFTHQGIGLRQLQITFFDEHTGLCVIDIGGTVAAFPYLGPLGNVNFFHLSSFL